MLDFINQNPITGTLLVLFLALILGNTIIRIAEKVTRPR